MMPIRKSHDGESAASLPQHIFNDSAPVLAPFCIAQYVFPLPGILVTNHWNPAGFIACGRNGCATENAAAFCLCISAEMPCVSNPGFVARL